MVFEVRARLCAEVAAPSGSPGRQLASGRAVRQDPGAAAVSVAAVDEDGDTIDILVPSRRNRLAALRFFRKLLKRQGCVPRRLIADKLRSYPAACRTMMPSVVHCTDQYANNRAEVSHQPTRQRERQMRRIQIRRPRATVSRGPRTPIKNPLSCRPPPPAGRPSSALANTGLRCLA